MKAFFRSQEASRLPKLFYVSSSTTTTTVSTQTVCYHVLSAGGNSLNGIDPVNCGKRRRRALTSGASTEQEANIQASKMSQGVDEEEHEPTNETDDREGKFLNYWLTRTITTTYFSYTTTSKMASLQCTPVGWTYISCAGSGHSRKWCGGPTAH